MNGPTFASTPAATTPAPKAAPPRPTTPSRAAARPDPDANNGLRVLTYLRLHWLMILFCGTLLGGAGAYAAWTFLPSKFESYALLQVSSAPTSLASGSSREQSRTDFATYVKTASALLKSEYVLNAALRDIKDLPTIKQQTEPIKFLDEEVMVNWQDGSEVIRVTFKGQNAGDVKRVVDSVQRAFMNEVVQKEVGEKRLLLGKIEDAKQEMERLLENKSKRPEQAKDLPGAPGGAVPAGGLLPPAPGVQPAEANGAPGPLPPLGPGNAVAPPPAAVGRDALELLSKLDPKVLVSRFAALNGEIERLPSEIQMLRTRMREVEGKLNAIKSAPISPFTMEAVDRDQEIIKQSLFVKQAKRAYDFARGASSDPNAPGIVDLKKSWEAQEAKLKQMREEKANLIEGAQRVNEAKDLAAQWETLKHEIERLEVQYANAGKTIAKLEKQLLEMPPPGSRGLNDLRLDNKPGYEPQVTDLMTLDGIYSRLVAQHQMVKYELDAPARIKLLQPASTPLQNDTRKQILGTVGAGLMGFLVIALGVVAYESLGRRVSSLVDLKTAGPAPVVGVIPLAAAAHGATGPQANEAIDKLRAYVTQTWLSRGATTVAVTSPLGDEGKAFTAFGLASSLAQAGYKTLVVDFDLRDPALHNYAGVANQTGVCEVLRGECEPLTAIQSLPSGLDLIPAGRWSDEARKAAVGGRLESLLLRLKEPYDCVILHSHSLLTAADSVEVARRCEVVLVCARYRETRVPLLKKATDRVATMEIPYSGVVYVGATEHEALC
jgi:Mrp family chromosome partitioning ATPase/predicted nuclease with TOPRIM domain